MSASVTFSGGDRPSQTARLTLSPTTISGAGYKANTARVSIPPAPPRKLALTFQRLLPDPVQAAAEFQYQATVSSTGSFRPVAGNLHLHRYYDFTESLVETVPKSLRLSCGSELTRQGISLP